MNTHGAPLQSRPSTQRLLTLACLALVLIFQLVATISSIEAPGTLMDEGMLLTYPELFAKGAVPQRDFESLYPPGNIWTLAGAYGLFGTNIQVERSVGLLYQLVLVSGVFTLLVRWNRLTASVGAVLCVCALLPLNLAAFAWIGAAALALWSVVAISAPGRLEWRALAAGALAGLALTYRADLGPALIAALGGYAMLSRWPRRAWLFLLLGGTLALLPLLAHVVAVTPAVFIDSVFIKPVLTCNEARTLPLDYSTALVGQLYSVLLISTALALLAGWREYRATTDHNPTLLAAGVLALGALPQALQRIDIFHISFVAPLALPLLAIATHILFSRRAFAPVFTFAAVLVLLPQTRSMLTSRLLGTAFPAERIPIVRSGDRAFPLSDRQYAHAAQFVVAQLKRHSRAGETVFVGPRDLRFTLATDTFLYHMLPWLKPRSYFLEMNPASANAPDSPLADEVADTDWLILNFTWNTIIEPNASRLPGPAAPNVAVRDGFDLAFSAPPFEVFKRRAKPSLAAVPAVTAIE